MSFSEAKDRLSELVKSTAETTRQVVITVNGRKQAVLISLEEYESMMETIEILRNQELVKKIESSMEDIRKGSVVAFDDIKKD